MTTQVDFDALDAEVAERVGRVFRAMRAEYAKRHTDPWLVAYSGGKDSTLLLQLVWKVLLSFPPKERFRQVYVVSNDTLVESPLVIKHLRSSIEVIGKAALKGNIPLQTEITKPNIDQTFWASVIGRGYIPPTRNFRWCTDRMKVVPTNKLINRLALRHRRIVLLIGTRRSESQNRKRSMDKYGVKANKMNPHGSIKGCRMFAPLADLDDDDIWMSLMGENPPWGGTHHTLITLYRDAGGGECPLVLGLSDEPSCGSSSPRFGCWTCTVVAKDKSLQGLISAGVKERDKLDALANFRDWLITLREDNSNRMEVRRDGTTKRRMDGTLVMGPFTLEVRENILDELLKLEKRVGEQLISKWEIDMIDEVWRIDRIRENGRQALMKKFA